MAIAVGIIPGLIVVVMLSRGHKFIIYLTHTLYQNRLIFKSCNRGSGTNHKNGQVTLFQFSLSTWVISPVISIKSPLIFIEPPERQHR